MKKVILSLSGILCTALVLLALAWWLPLPVPYYQDFSVMYFTNRARLHGIPIYDYPAQLSYIKTLTPATFTFHPYPYPPWYALSTLFLGLMPIKEAARAWFLLNLGLLGISAAILSRHWKRQAQPLGILAAILFLPSLGLLVVGQYSLPVLLGVALFGTVTSYELRMEGGRVWNPPVLPPASTARAGWTATGLLLMTFKPHIGGLMFLAGFIWLLWDVRGSANSRLALRLTIAGGLLFALLGFLADPGWPFTYIQSLGLYRSIPGVESCGICASLPALLVQLFAGQSNMPAALGVGLALLTVFGMVFFWRFRSDLRDPFFLMAVSAALTLVIDPYLLNYDYVLLLIPLAWLARRNWKPALAILLLPWIIIFLSNRAGTPSSSNLLSLTGLLTMLLILRTKPNSI